MSRDQRFILWLVLAAALLAGLCGLVVLVSVIVYLFGWVWLAGLLGFLVLAAWFALDPDMGGY